MLTVVPMSKRRWLYAVFLGVGLLTTFAGALWRINAFFGHGGPLPLVDSSYSRAPITLIDCLVLSFTAVAGVGLLWLRPRPIAYIIGLLCLLIAFIGFWLASPNSGRWVGSSILHDPGYGPYGGRWFGMLFFLFPLGWVLLGASVSNWKKGLVAYLLVGLAFVLLGEA